MTPIEKLKEAIIDYQNETQTVIISLEVEASEEAYTKGGIISALTIGVDLKVTAKSK